MNIKQLQSKLDALNKSKAGLESKRDTALKALDEKRAALKSDWDSKIALIQTDIDQYLKAIREQEKIEAMLEQARKSADALIKGTNNDNGEE